MSGWLRKALLSAVIGYWILRPVRINLMATERTDGAPWPMFGTPTADALADTRLRPPQTKAEGQKVLRGFGYTGLKIDKIETLCQEGKQVGVVYALTSPVLQENGEMHRQAQTIVLRFDNGEVKASRLDGWPVLREF